MTDNIIVAGVADLHSNSTTGLYNPDMVVLGKRPHDASAFQAKLWKECWLEFWQRVARAKKEHKLPVVGVFNGDIIDVAPKVGKLISSKPSVAKAIAMFNLEPALEVADVVFLVAGTDWHTGEEADHEEDLAMMIGAEPDRKGGRAVWRHLKAQWGGLLWDVIHHPATKWGRPWTKAAAVAREGEIVRRRSQDVGEPVPDIVVRAHVHDGAMYKGDIPPAVFFCPPWELRGAFAYRKSYTVSGPSGGFIWIVKDGEYANPMVKYPRQRRRPWSRKVQMKESPSRQPLARLMSLLRGPRG
jgi:hypothetical protein